MKILGLLGVVVLGGVALSPYGIRSPQPALAPVSSPTEVSNPAENSHIPTASDYVSVRPTINELPAQSLSSEELSGLRFMREEEKLARDVYSVLYDTWGLPIFANIAQSEQTHTEAVLNLLVKYGVPDPVTDDSVGVFTNSDLQKLYLELTTKGTASIEEALRVGAFIEDLDIVDLQKELAKTDNADITLVYENLLRGSRNHLRSFVSQLSARNQKYTPEFISLPEYENIISSAQESGASAGGRGWGKHNKL